MTAKKIADTVTAELAAANVDVNASIGGSPHHHQNITITNLHASAVVGVAWGGVVAAIHGDDVRHIGPFGWITIPYTKTLSIVSNTAATPVEIAGT